MRAWGAIGIGALVWAASVARAAQGAPAACRAVDLGTLGGRASHAAAIAPDGTVVGSADTPERTVAALFRDGRVIALEAPAAGAAAARAIDGQGRVVGSAEVAAEVTHAALWNAGGQLRDLGALGGRTAAAAAGSSQGRDAAATGINRWGEVVGYSQTAASNTSPYHAFTFRRGRLVDLGAPGGADSMATDINDWGTICGFYGRREGGSVAFVYFWGRFIDLGHLGGGDAEARALNDGGQVVGASQTATGQRHAFRWSAGRMRDLGTLGGKRAEALAINRAGDVVGTSETADGAMHAFLVRDEGPMIDLHALAAPPAGVVLREAVGIDDSGRIAANGRLGDGPDHAFRLVDCR